MNRRRMLQLAKAIEHNNRFDLNVFFMLTNPDEPEIKTSGELVNHCGTVGCVAGWALAVFDPEFPAHYGGYTDRAAEILDLTDDEAFQLFVPGSESTVWGPNPYDADAVRAAKVLRDLASGEVEFQPDN